MAVTEVVFVLAVAHVTYRLLRQFTAWGRWEHEARTNFTTGWTLIAFAYAAAIVFRRDIQAYGLAAARWPQELAETVQAVARRTHTTEMLWWCALGLYIASCIVFGLFHLSVGALVLLVAWQFLATALGEEVFFRGYALSRLNDSFDRQWAFLGVRFGWGVVWSALLFGVLHGFNTIDYFSGRFSFAWSLALATALSGLVSGYIREATGSIAPSLVIHGLTNLFWFTILPKQTQQLLGRHGG